MKSKRGVSVPQGYLLDVREGWLPIPFQGGKRLQVVLEDFYLEIPLQPSIFWEECVSSLRQRSKPSLFAPRARLRAKERGRRRQSSSNTSGIWLDSPPYIPHSMHEYQKKGVARRASRKYLKRKVDARRDGGPSERGKLGARAPTPGSFRKSGI